MQDWATDTWAIKKLTYDHLVCKPCKPVKSPNFPIKDWGCSEANQSFK